MTSINPNDGVNRVNNSFKNEKVVDKKEKPVVESKTAEASSLDALNSYGKANMSFKGKITDSLEKEILKKKVIKKCSNRGFGEETVGRIFNHVNSDNIKFVESLFFAEDKNGKKLIENRDYFESLVKALTLDKLEFADKLIFGEDGVSHGRAYGLTEDYGPHGDFTRNIENRPMLKY